MVNAMSMVLPGCVLHGAPDSKYAKSLRFAEFSPRTQLPRVSTLRRWHYELPEDFSFALHAPRSAVVSSRGALRLDDEMKKSIDWTLEAAEALAAVAVRFETPIEVTPSARSRDLLAAYTKELPRIEGRVWVWTPNGLWEPWSADRLAERLDLVRSFDPVSEPSPRGKIAYARLRTLGVRFRLSTEVLRTAVANLVKAPVEKAYFTLDSDGSLNQVLLLKRLIEAESEGLEHLV